jgi:hypothetical protein
MPYDDPQVSFCVENAESPECVAIDGKCEAKPKTIGKVDVLADLAKLLFEEPFSVESLAHQRFRMMAR